LCRRFVMFVLFSQGLYCITFQCVPNVIHN
jgi:hypothetical protein